MPYSYHKEGDKYVVTKKDSGKVVGRTKGTKEALKNYLAALHINANEGKTNTMKKSELIQMIQEIIKEVISESSTPTKIVRKIMWDKSRTPQELAAQIKKLSDATLLKWAEGNTGIPNTPLAFQQKLVKIELAKRGLTESTDYMKRRKAMDDYSVSKKDAPKKPYKEPSGKTDYMKRREADKKANESADYDTAVAFRLVAKGNRDAALEALQAEINKVTGVSGRFSKVKATIIPSKGNPQDIIVKLNGPSAFSMGKDITAKDKAKVYTNPVIRNNFSKVSPYTPQLTKI